MADPEDDPVGSRWSTASFGQPADTSPVELTALGEHLDLCRTSGRLSTLRHAWQVLRSFIAAHPVSSVVVVGLIGSSVWLVWTVVGL